MSTVARSVITSEEMLAMPDDGIDRELIRGELRERPITRRSRRHSRTTTKVAACLERWLALQKEPRGEVLSGDAAFRLTRDPETTVGIDVAYISAEIADRSADDAFLIDSPPVLAVEILSPSDTHEDVVEKLQLYLESGTRVVWIMDPDLRTVTVHRPGFEPALFTASQELTGDPKLPGFRAKVAALFAR